MISSSVFFVLFCLILGQVNGHGYMLNPVSRASRWRYNYSAPRDYNDNGLFCGGYYVQHWLNDGLCGVCGDSYSDPHPQPNENTGTFGNGITVATYKTGSVIEVSINLTSNHLGTFNYSLCVLEDVNSPEPESCFQPLLLEDGSEKSKVSSNVNNYIDKVKLPNVTCDRCVFRWTYRAANSYGECSDGEYRLGCGAQEHFRNCADISIVS